MLETWARSDLASTQDINARVLETRLLHACERVEVVSKAAAKRMRSGQTNELSVAVLNIFDAATMDIQSRTSTSAPDRLERYFKVRYRSSQIADLLEADFDSWQSKWLPF